MKITPLRGKITAQLLEDPRKETVTKTGVILLADNATEGGMKPRWFKALSVHPEEKDVNEGDYILVAHGRWSREYKRENKDGEKEVLIVVESDSFLGISDEFPNI